MQILFIQLPLIDHTRSYIQGNIDYAPSALSGYIRKNFGPRVKTSGLPCIISNFGSENLVTEYVLKSSPDVVCFTCYLWNIEKNIAIARRIKNADDNIRIIFGGPEINSGSIALAQINDCVDCMVSGEGEWFFKNFLCGNKFDNHYKKIKGNNLYIQNADDLIAPEEIFEPFSGMMLDTMIDGSVYLELTRGCPYRCSYCCYSKNSTIVRSLPFEVLLRAIRRGGALKEIYILSPSLETTRDFTEKLRMLAGVNNGVRLHSEMRASAIDGKMAGLLYDAGFRSMEVGIQTLSAAALKNVRRNSDPEKELRGMEALKSAGIDLKIGMIPGLPGDTPGEFISSIDRLVELGFGNEIEFYPLMILPGTAIRDQAIDAGAEFLKKPPYYYHSGWGFCFDDLIASRAYIEEKTGYSMSLNALPEFSYSDAGLFYSAAFFNGDIPGEWDADIYRDIIETNVFGFHIAISYPENIYRYLRRFLNDLPNGELYNIIFYCDEPVDQEKLVRIVSDIETDNFYRRLNIFNEWADGLKCRFFQVFSNAESFARCGSLYSLVQPVLRVNAGPLKLLDREADLLVAAGAFSLIGEEILEDYSGCPERVAFEDESEQAEFYRLVDYDHVELPVAFKRFGG